MQCHVVENFENFKVYITNILNFVRCCFLLCLLDRFVVYASGVYMHVTNVAYLLYIIILVNIFASQGY